MTLMLSSLKKHSHPGTVLKMKMAGAMIIQKISHTSALSNKNINQSIFILVGDDGSCFMPF